MGEEERRPVPAIAREASALIRVTAAPEPAGASYEIVIS